MHDRPNANDLKISSFSPSIIYLLLYCQRFVTTRVKTRTLWHIHRFPQVLRNAVALIMNSLPSGHTSVYVSSGRSSNQNRSIDQDEFFTQHCMILSARPTIVSNFTESEMTQSQIPKI
jgi:hypothetical protein